MPMGLLCRRFNLCEAALPLLLAVIGTPLLAHGQPVPAASATVVATSADDIASPVLLEEGFEQWDVGTWPGTWFIEAGNGECVIREEQSGNAGRFMHVKPESTQSGPVVATKSIDAAMFRRGWHRGSIRLRQAAPGGVASFWIQSVTEDGVAISTSSSHTNPVTITHWREASVLFEVPEGTRTVEIGVVSVGGSGVYADAFAILPAQAPTSLATPAAPLTDQERRNLTALARLWGPVRYFHASNASIHTSWNLFTLQLVREMREAKDDAAANDVLRRGFGAVCPLLAIVPQSEAAIDGSEPEVDKPEGGTTVSQMIYRGYADPLSAIGVPGPAGSVFESTRSILSGIGDEAAIVTTERIELGNGFVAHVPPAWLDDAGDDIPAPRAHAFSDDALHDAMTYDDRAVRLAAVITAWGTLSQFHPHLNEAIADWDAALGKAMDSAATDPNIDAFMGTLETLVGTLGDGHAAAAVPGAAFRAPLPIQAQFMDDDLVVVAADPSTSATPGDVIVAVDGTSTEDLVRTLRPRVSASTDGHADLLLARRILVTNSMAESGNEPKGWAMIDLRSPDGSTRSSRVLPRQTFERPDSPRPANGSVLAPGILYLHLPTLSNHAVRDMAGTLSEAKGLVLDVRGQPDQGAVLLMRMLSDVPRDGAAMRVPILKRPLQRDRAQHITGWTLQPATPALKAKVIFLADANSIGYAETLLDLASHHRMGRIVGTQTAGAVGDLNVIYLPGEGAIQFTGTSAAMRAGNERHGSSIMPTDVAIATREGIAAGRDEVVEKALELLKSELDPQGQ